MGCAMDRRIVIKGLSAAGALATAGQFPAPAVGQPSQVLKFVPQANLANFDPIWGTQYVVRNASQLVWDTLYGMDSADLLKKIGMTVGGFFEARRWPTVPQSVAT